MRFEDLVRVVVDEPLFETGLLLAGDVDPADVRRQLSRWARSGKVLQLRRGLYALAPPYQKVPPHRYTIANQLARPSYVSCQTVLAEHGLIPEHVPVTMSVTTGRPGHFVTAVGDFVYRHVRPGLFGGFVAVPVGVSQPALVATPEKALLDLVYLAAGARSAPFIAALRLQNLDVLDLGRLGELARQSGSPRLVRAAAQVAALATAEHEGYEAL